MPDVNVPLLRKTLEHITLHQDEWNQSVWFSVSAQSACGTAGCLAGHAAVLSGVALEYAHEQVYDCFPYGRTVEVPTNAIGGRRLRTVARQELGLEDDEAYRLFACFNTLSELWRLAAVFTHGEISASEMDALLQQ